MLNSKKVSQLVRNAINSNKMGVVFDLAVELGTTITVAGQLMRDKQATRVTNANANGIYREIAKGVHSWIRRRDINKNNMTMAVYGRDTKIFNY